MNWIVTLHINPADDADKVKTMIVEVRVDNCADPLTASALAGAHIKRYFQFERKIGIRGAEAVETQ